MTNSADQRLFARKGLAAFCLLGFLFWGFNPAMAGRPLQPGTEVFAVAPEKVVEISYRTADFWFLAHRWQAGDRFSLIFFKRGKPLPEACLAGKGFQKVLSQLASLKLRQTPTPEQTTEFLRHQPLTSWAELVIRDDSALEPFQARISPVAGSPGEVWLHFNGATYLVTLDHRVLKLISGGCQALSPGESP